MVATSGQRSTRSLCIRSSIRRIHSVCLRCLATPILVRRTSSRSTQFFGPSSCRCLGTAAQEWIAVGRRRRFGRSHGHSTDSRNLRPIRRSRMPTSTCARCTRRNRRTRHTRRTRRTRSVCRGL